MAWCVNNGLIAKNDYLATIAKAWNGIADSAIHANGFLGYVQGTGSKPGDMGSATGLPTYNSVPDFDDYGLGCVLLAGSEVAKLSDVTNIGSTPGAARVHANAPPVRFSRGCLTIATGELVPAHVLVSDAMGRVVLQKDIRGQEILRLPPNAANGVYIVHVDAGGKNAAFDKITMVK